MRFATIHNVESYPIHFVCLLVYVYNPFVAAPFETRPKIDFGSVYCVVMIADGVKGLLVLYFSALK
jgi:hypothetical protein